MSDPAPTPSRLVPILRNLDPRALFFGPIFQKDMRISGRKLGVYIGRCAFALLLAVVITIAFVSVLRNTGQRESASARIQALQGVAPVFVISVLWVQFGAMTLLAPVLTGGAICEERRAQTLPALLTTPLSPLQIVCSKGASRLAQLLIIGLLSLPVLLGVRLFGGVRAETVLAGASISISATIMAASVGLFFSSRAARATTATLAAYCTLILLMAGLPLLGVALNEYARHEFPSARLPQVLGAWAPNWPLRIPDTAIYASSPPAALGAVSWGSDQGVPVRDIWVSSTIVSLVISLFSVGLASLSLRGVMRRSLGAPRLTRSQRRTRRKAIAAGDAPPEQSGALRSRRSRRVGDLPVLWREIRQSLFPTRAMLAVSILGVLLIEGVMLLAMDIDEIGLAMVPVLIGMVLILLQAALLSSSGFSSEREARTLDVLLTSRVSPFQLVAGKLLGSIRRQWFIPLVLLAHTALIVDFAEAHPIVLVHLTIIMLGPILMLSGTGVFFGLCFRKSITASAVNLALALALWLLLPIGGVVVAELVFNSGDLSQSFGHFVIFTHPVAQGVISVEGAHDEFAERITNLDYDVIDADLTGVGWTIYLVCAFLIQAFVGVLGALAAVLRFTRYTGRTP